jgi:hypothetical protein
MSIKIGKQSLKRSFNKLDHEMLNLEPEQTKKLGDFLFRCEKVYDLVLDE